MCSPYCITCSGNSTNCSSCTLTGTFMAYFYNNTCVLTCPTQYYAVVGATSNDCMPCNTGCQSCTTSSSFCSQCLSNYYLYQNSCGLTCPSGYFSENSTWSCLSCDQFCVSLTMDMYFSDALNTKIYVDLIFSDNIDFNTFPYTSFL